MPPSDPGARADKRAALDDDAATVHTEIAELRRRLAALNRDLGAIDRARALLTDEDGEGERGSD